MKYAVSPISTTWNDFDRAFRDLTQGFFEPPSLKVEKGFIPRVEVYENEEYYGLSVDLPGFNKEDLKVEVDGDHLTVRGERKKEERVEGSFYTEKVYGAFSRTFQLPKDAGREDVKAEFKNGVLDLRLKREEKTTNRNIEIVS